MTIKFNTSLLAAALIGGLLAGPALAADRAALQGLWEPRNGSMKLLDQPVLTDKGKALAQATRVAGNAQNGVGVISRYCLPESQPWNLLQSAPIDIVQDERETTMMFEHHSVPYHIYTDGRGHPDPATSKPTQNGHAIGHWEGDTFVTDSVNFTLYSGPGLAGGMPKSPSLHVVARFTPSADGQQLYGHFTVDDPENLAKPYSWDFTWYRSAPGSYAALEPCDPRDLANSHY